MRRPLAELLSGELLLGKDINPLAIQLLIANPSEIGHLLEILDIPWSIKNYITLEPLQAKILALESEESKIV